MGKINRLVFVLIIALGKTKFWMLTINLTTENYHSQANLFAVPLPFCDDFFKAVRPFVANQNDLIHLLERLQQCILEPEKNLNKQLRCHKSQQINIHINTKTPIITC